MGFLFMTPRITILDYGSGNLRSVLKAIELCGGVVRLASSAQHIEDAEALVVPGVGAFGDCLANLRRAGMDGVVREWVAAGRPYLGICLGYQLLFEGSEESPGVQGLGILPGTVRRFPASSGKVPHMGWNQVQQTRGPLFASASPNPWFYFVHSYYPELQDPACASSWCEYGVRFASSVSLGSLHATQFHPEKSQSAGLNLLKDFLATLGHTKPDSCCDPVACH